MMGNCDMCNAPIGPEAKLYSADEMRKAVAAGFHVDTFYGGIDAKAYAASLGLSPEQAEEGWLRRVQEDTTDWALCPDCATKMEECLTEAQAQASPAARPTKDVTVRESYSLGDRVETWTEQFQAAQKEVTKRGWLSFLIGGLGPLAVAGLVFWLGPNQSWVFGVGLLGTIVAWPTIHNLWAGKAKKQAVHQLTSDIQQTCETEGLSKAEVVEALAAQLPAGGMCQSLLAAVDPETAAIIDIRQRGLAFFDKKDAGRKEEDALKFRSITLDYLSRKLYVEAIAALGMASTIYAEIAPPFQSGVDVDSLIRFTADPAERVKLATRKVLGSFDFEPDLKAVLETSTRRRSASLLNLLLAAQGQGTDAAAALAEASEGLKPLVRDEIFVRACLEYLGDRATQKIEALRALALIPDIRILPYLLKAFDLLPFYPQGIEACIRLGESTHPQLLEALHASNPNRRYNVALALGVMEVEAARPVLTGLLNTVTNPAERIGCCYGLVKLGEISRLDEIVQVLDHPDGDIRHAAAIALEHLSQPLADALYLRHLTDSNGLVRLRLTRRLGAQGTDNPDLIEALMARFGDSEENVRSAAVDAMAKLGAEEVYDRTAKLAASGTGTTRDCAYQVLGKLGDSRAEPLLAEALQKHHSADTRRTVLSALADLQAVGAADQIAKYLGDSKLSGAAFWALLRLGSKDRDAVTRILRRHSDRPQRLFALTILDDEKAKKQFNALLSSSTDIQTLLQVCDYARILSNPEFEKQLRNLLNYSKQEFAPTDKYIPYAAFKALIHTLLARS
jgi:HEAT repeat protein